MKGGKSKNWIASNPVRRIYHHEYIVLRWDKNKEVGQEEKRNLI